MGLVFGKSWEEPAWGGEVSYSELEERGGLRELIRRAMPSMAHDTEWVKRAEELLASKLRPEYLPEWAKKR